MSLVDYDASSSEEDDDALTREPPTTTKPREASVPRLPRSSSQNLSDMPESSNPLPAPSFEKLPDASELLNSADFSSSGLSGNDHSSLVAAAMAQSASRKRDSVGLSSSRERNNKIPKGALTNSKNVPDTAGQMLVPPQLCGRSNVVTEDINKLFVKKKADPTTK